MEIIRKKITLPISDNRSLLEICREMKKEIKGKGNYKIMLSSPFGPMEYPMMSPTPKNLDEVKSEASAYGFRCFNVQLILRKYREWGDFK